MVDVQVHTEVASERLRRVQVPVLVGSTEKLRTATGWTPRHTWRDMLESVSPSSAESAPCRRELSVTA